jgi:hypothetical protein
MPGEYPGIVFFCVLLNFKKQFDTGTQKVVRLFGVVIRGTQQDVRLDGVKKSPAAALPRGRNG